MTNRQEIFNTVYLGLASQNWKPSKRFLKTGPGCAYRGEGGMKCAAGYLIPDEFYDVTWEGYTADDVPYLMDTFGEELEMIEDLQYLHDCFFDDEVDSEGKTMKDAFEHYANKFDLTVPA